MKKITVLLVASLLIMVFATPAQAAVVGVNPIDVTTPPTSGANWQTGDLIRWEAGMTGSDPVSGVLVATITPECGVKVQRSTLNLTSIAQIGRGSFRTLASPGRYTLGIEYQAVYGDPAMFESQQLITIVGAGIDACGVEWDASGPVGPTPTPDPVVNGSVQEPLGQGLPVPVSGDCRDIDERDAVWARDLKGGWTIGWTTWRKDDGTVFHDGFSCNRVIEYRDDLWQVRTPDADARYVL